MRYPFYSRLFTGHNPSRRVRKFSKCRGSNRVGSGGAVVRTLGGSKRAGPGGCQGLRLGSGRVCYDRGVPGTRYIYISRCITFRPFLFLNCGAPWPILNPIVRITPFLFCKTSGATIAGAPLYFSCSEKFSKFGNPRPLSPKN